LAIDGDELKSYLEQYRTVVDSILSMTGLVDLVSSPMKKDMRVLKRQWLLFCILSATSMLKSIKHSQRLLELPFRHHPQQQIQILVDVVEECLITPTSIQIFMAWQMPMDELDGRLATAT